MTNPNSLILFAEQDSLEEYDEEEDSPRPYCTLCEYAIGEVARIQLGLLNFRYLNNDLSISGL